MTGSVIVVYQFLVCCCDVCAALADAEDPDVP
jgi:hypothetical protein